jgi:superfamily II DNA/RNA helicase
MPNEIVFALIHGQIESEERMKIINIFNSNENVNGDLITILCLSKASVEGINIKHIRKVHIMEA